MHLTLKFLGGISPDTAERVTAVMKEAALGLPPFVLGVRGLGIFPDQRRVQIIWAGITGDLTVLDQVQKRLDAGLTGLGFPVESRAFTAHLTLARIRDDASRSERETMGNLALATGFEGGEFVVDAISLIRSDLRREGPLYTRMVTLPFSRPGEA
jgi:2'-5' RNA ligase